MIAYDYELLLLVLLFVTEEPFGDVLEDLIIRFGTRIDEFAEQLSDGKLGGFKIQSKPPHNQGCVHTVRILGRSFEFNTNKKK